MFPSWILETAIIVIALGGLEVILWFADHNQQKKQNELLDAILVELAIQNSETDEGN